MKEKNSYRKTRENDIDKNIKNLKKSGIIFHYDRSEREKYQAKTTPNEKIWSFLRIAVVVCCFSVLFAWCFLKFFQEIL